MPNRHFQYAGRDNLEVMAEAVNYNRHLAETVAKYVGGHNARVLDFGAGSGTYADLLSGFGIVPDVLEPDPIMRRALHDRGYQVVDPVEVADDAGRYSAVYALNVLEHIDDDAAAVHRLAQLVRPGGSMLIYVPAFPMLFSAMDEKVEHFRRYRRKPLEALVASAGMIVTTSTYCDPVGLVAALVYKWFGNSDGSISPTGLRLFDRVAFPISRVLQCVTGRFFGKNLLIVATRPSCMPEDVRRPLC